MKQTTSERLKILMETKGLTQADIYRLCQPICKKYNIKLERNVLSQYVSGKYLPVQSKITILSEALNVNEAWLMGYDVPMKRGTEKEAPTSESVLTEFEQQIIELCKTVPEENRKDFIDYLKTAVKMMK